MLGRATVVGPSMVPTLRHGDRVLVRYGAPVRAGDIVVVEVPGGPLSVKRAVRREDQGWWVEGDNPLASTDSRTFGRVSDEAVVGRVVLRYRRGRDGDYLAPPASSA